MTTLKKASEQYASLYFNKYFGSALNTHWVDSRDTFLAGARWMNEQCAKEVEQWGTYYPDDVFTPLPKFGTDEQKAQDNALVTRATAHMGRHMSHKVAEDIRALLETEEK